MAFAIGRQSDQCPNFRFLTRAMQDLQQQLAHRYPQWFEGRRGLLARPLVRGISRWSRMDAIREFIACNRELRDFAFVRAALEFLGVHHECADADRGRIPATGRLLIVANHPLGALDALALLHEVGRVRRDVRIVANDFLQQIGNLDSLLLPVRILGGRPTAESVNAIEESLLRDECVIVFPAGEVARLGLRGIQDGPWRRGFVRFARRTGARVLPVRVKARNSALFYGASTINKALGTTLLAREMFARRGRRLQLQVGEPMSLPQDMAADDALSLVRNTLHAIGKFAPESAPMGPEPIIDPVPQVQVEHAIRKLRTLGQTSDGQKILCGRLNADSPLLREIGRLRELTFRAVGEGTGRAFDTDAYDTWYEHIVLWDERQKQVAGAYRISRGAQVLAERGIGGWYTASLFEYSEKAIARIAQGMELGRSFVVPAYWGGRSIDYLWQGIGAYLAQHPGVRYLYGPVSISAALPAAARDQIVAYYSRYYGDVDELGRSRRPFSYFAAPPVHEAADPATAFRILRQNLDAVGATLPMLYKQYTELCEPGGVRFLAFGVDPDFGDAIDGLIEVDIDCMRPHKRARYIAAHAASAKASK